MSIQAISPQAKASLNMERYSSVYEPEFKKTFSSNPLIMKDRNAALGDRVEFLTTKNKELKEQRLETLADIEQEYAEASKLADEIIEDLNKAQREADNYFDMRKAEVRALTQNIIAQYHLNTKNMNPRAAQNFLQASLASLSGSGLPKSITSRIEHSALGLNALNFKSAKISSLTLEDEFLATKMNDNAMSIMKTQALMGTPITPQVYTSTVSFGRMFATAARSIFDNLNGMFSRIQFGSRLSERSVDKLKEDMNYQIRPKDDIGV